MSKVSTYFHLHLRGVPKNIEEDISSICFNYGALGVSENLDFNKKVYPKPEIIEKDFKNLDVYFEKQPQALINFLDQKYPEIEIELQEQETKDWLAEWKKGFHAFCLYEQFWVVPSWENAPENVTPLFIDPGMAFGTGTHETTQICSELLVKTLHKEKILSLIDVGTGTGILAFLAAKMNVPNILGTDNDPEAIRVSTENATKNKIDMKFSTSDLPMIREKFDMVVANIIDGVLLNLKNNLIQKMNDNGFMILSGIIIENDKEFFEDFMENSNLKLIERLQKGEWVGYLLQKMV